MGRLVVDEIELLLKAQGLRFQTVLDVVKAKRNQRKHSP